jgi:hypothetical protein
MTDAPNNLDEPENDNAIEGRVQALLTEINELLRGGGSERANRAAPLVNELREILGQNVFKFDRPETPPVSNASVTTTERLVDGTRGGLRAGGAFQTTDGPGIASSPAPASLAGTGQATLSASSTLTANATVLRANWREGQKPLIDDIATIRRGIATIRPIVPAIVDLIIERMPGRSGDNRKSEIIEDANHALEIADQAALVLESELKKVEPEPQTIRFLWLGLRPLETFVKFLADVLKPGMKVSGVIGLSGLTVIGLIRLCQKLGISIVQVRDFLSIFFQPGG